MAISSMKYKTFKPYFPVLPLIPLIFLHIPSQISPKRAVAGYFQALAISRLGVDSLLVNTPVENLSSLHFHSFLSSPFIALGYTEAGRLISLIAAIAAVATTISLAKHWMNQEIAILSGVLLWFIPLFLISAFSFMPESLSIFLTTAAVLSAVRAVETNKRIWSVLCGVCIIFGVFTHLWEAIVIIPVLVIFIRSKNPRKAVQIAIITLVTVIVSYGLTHIQPRGASSLISYSLFGERNWWYLLDLNWWLPPVGPLDTGSRATSFGISPLRSLSKLMIVGGVIMLIYWGIRWQRHKDYSIVMLAWTASGLSIPIALPGGFLAHYYYSWGLVVPIAITMAVIVGQLIPEDKVVEISHITTLFAVVGIVLPLVLTPVVPFTTSVSSPLTPIPGIQVEGPSDKAIDRAEELKKYELKSTEGIVFVGSFSEENRWSGSFPAYVLIYSDILVTGRTFEDSDIRISDTKPDDCSVVIYRDRIETCN